MSKADWNKFGLVALGFFIAQLIHPMPISLDVWDGVKDVWEFVTDTIEDIQQ